ncbi:MAG: phosphatidylglycerol lysyltransferase domain-containing protein [Chthoniobacterales bacterium]
MATQVLATAVAVCGLINIAQGLLPKEPGVLEWMAQFLPFSVSQHSRVLLLGGGVFQLLLSRGLLRGKHAALLLALGLLTVIPLLHLGSAFDWHHAVSQLFVAAALLYWRKEFQAQSDGPSLRWAILIGVLLLVALVLFGVVTFQAFGLQISGTRTLGRELQTIGELIFLQSTDTLIPTGLQAGEAFRTISDAGLFFGLIVAFLFLRPIMPRRAHGMREEQRACAIIAVHGVDPLDEFALLSDKRHFFSEDGSSFIAYALWRNIAVTLGDPVGPRHNIPKVIVEFIAFCFRQDWDPVFYEIRPDFLDVYREAGFRRFKIAEDARLDIPTFSFAGQKFQKLRTAHSKALRSGWTVSLTPGTGLSSRTQTQIRAISDDWLSSRHRIEMRFDLGSMDAASLNAAEFSILHDEEGNALAFASWLPYAQGKGRSLDMIRHRPTDRRVIDPLMVGCLLDYKKRGLDEISLGNAPLANIEQRDIDSFEEKAVRILYERFDHYYGYRSLFDFKNKFQPRWEGRYLAYNGFGNLLPAIAAIVRVHLPEGMLRFLRS